jgi:hypothetical protein
MRFSYAAPSILLVLAGSPFLAGASTCPITSVNEDSAETGPAIVTCPSDFPAGHECSAINFHFDILGDAIGDVIITYKYKGDDANSYDLKAGTYHFTDQTEEPSCAEQETVVTVSAAHFNKYGPNHYIVKDGVLNVSMHQVENGTNGCAKPQNLATINLQYQFYDCMEEEL